MALVETQTVSTQDVFLSYAVMQDGRTLAERVRESPQFLLGRQLISQEEIGECVVQCIHPLHESAVSYTGSTDTKLGPFGGAFSLAWL